MKSSLAAVKRLRFPAQASRQVRGLFILGLGKICPSSIRCWGSNPRPSGVSSYYHLTRAPARAALLILCSCFVIESNASKTFSVFFCLAGFIETKLIIILDLLINNIFLHFQAAVNYQLVKCTGERHPVRRWQRRRLCRFRRLKRAK